MWKQEKGNDFIHVPFHGQKGAAMDWMFISTPQPSNSYVDTIIHNVMVFGDGAWEVIRFRLGHESGAPMMGLMRL